MKVLTIKGMLIKFIVIFYLLYPKSSFEVLNNIIWLFTLDFTEIQNLSFLV